MDTTSKKPEFDAKAAVPSSASKPEASATTAADKSAVKTVYPLTPPTGRSM